MKNFGLFLLLFAFLGCNLPSAAGVFSKIGNWFNTGWNDYGYPSHNNYYNYPHRHGFYNRGNFTGVTPPVAPSYRTNYYNPNSNYYCPNSVNNRFNHFPNGSIPQMNVPTQVITDFNSNVGTSTGVRILD